jgi:hypothetical protein
MCGAVRYESTGGPVDMRFCHCRDCQRITGSAFAAVMNCPQSLVKITGEVKYYEYRADSGNLMQRGFCPNCGSPMFVRPSAWPGVLVIMAGSLDDPSWFKPEMDIYAPSAQHWDVMNPALRKYAKYRE